MKKLFLVSKMQVFTIIWFGQLVSLLGSNLTGFALGVWVYKNTGSVTQFVLISLFTQLPGIMISPLAGALVDRWDRRWVMFFSDCGAGLSILAIALLFFTSHLEIWHIYFVCAANSMFSALRWPAYAAAMTLLVPARHLVRANGMVQLGQSVGELISPMLGSLLLVTIQIQGVLLLDFTTFLFSLIMLLLIRVPKPETTTQVLGSKTSLWGEALVGWIYLKTRLDLFGLLIFFSITNFLVGIVSVLITPLLLSFMSVAVFGTMLSIGGSGMLVGSVVMSTWGGFQRPIDSVFSFMLLCGLCIMVAGLRPTAWLFAVAAFFFFFSLSIVSGSSQAIFQSKVVPDVQGRVFALRRMSGSLSLSLGYLVAGPLADLVFEPLLAPGGFLVGSIGQLIGVGRGRGIGLMFIVMGALTMLATVVAYQYPPLRLLELKLPNAIADPATKCSEN